MGEIRNLNCKTRPVKRAAGQSAVVGAAYRAGERLFDERQERTADYSRPAPDVRETLILTPDNAPAWASDRQQLWNMAEAAERRKDGRPARDVQVGLAWELTPDEQRAAVIKFANSEFVSKGHVADIAFHRYGQRVNDMSDAGRDTIRRWAEQDVPFLESDECGELNEPHVKIERGTDGQASGYKIYQPHAHIYLTPRALDGDTFAAKRNRDLDRSEMAMHWRYEWPRIQNEYLEKAGHDARVTATKRKDDHAPQQLDDTVQGVAHAMELRGEQTRAREVAEFNSVHNEVIALATPQGQESPSQDEANASQVNAHLEAPDGFIEAHNAAITQAMADQSVTTS
ncbi:MAG: MobA/MobL family protein [Sulfitobacter sp.]